ncbi:MAG: hypothetical protein IJS32_03975 [Kiritimatiellae bacterium]|nr:hypothetical protein [Kiritimatiellia bacterium]
MTSPRAFPVFLLALAAAAAFPARATTAPGGCRIPLAAPVRRDGQNPAPRAIPVNRKARVFLLRWNPAISSFTPEEFADAVACYRENGRDGFNWSVREAEKVRPGDIALFCRVGTEADRIDGVGVFTGRTRTGASWRGDGTRVGYADCVFDFVQDPSEPLLFPAEELAAAFPDCDWHGGPSGIALDAGPAEALAEFTAQRLSSLLPAAFAGECAARPDILWALTCRILSGACPDLRERTCDWSGPLDADALPFPPEEGVAIGYDPGRTTAAGFSARDLRPIARERVRRTGGPDGQP